MGEGGGGEAEVGWAVAVGREWAVPSGAVEVPTVAVEAPGMVAAVGQAAMVETVGHTAGMRISLAPQWFLGSVRPSRSLGRRTSLCRRWAARVAGSTGSHARPTEARPSGCTSPLDAEHLRHSCSRCTGILRSESAWPLGSSGG